MCRMSRRGRLRSRGIDRSFASCDAVPWAATAVRRYDSCPLGPTTARLLLLFGPARVARLPWRHDDHTGAGVLTIAMPRGCCTKARKDPCASDGGTTDRDLRSIARSHPNPGPGGRVDLMCYPVAQLMHQKVEWFVRQPPTIAIGRSRSTRRPLGERSGHGAGVTPSDHMEVVVRPDL